MTTYDERYAGDPDYFGIAPDELLLAYWHRIDRGRPALDLGAEQGRHALFLARRGFQVEAVDPSRGAGWSALRRSRDATGPSSAEEPILAMPRGLRP